jgi:tRNA pseudouridine32 synthase / 23S rRNA pseudouridine746 synthase
MTPEEMVARLLYRDGLMLVIDKPAGLAVHQGPPNGRDRGRECLQDHFDALRFGLPRSPALAHRLDRDTSGCLVLGRHRKALAQLGKLFKNGAVEKTYWAVVEGSPDSDEGTIALPLGRLDVTRGWWMKHDPEGQPAVTKWKVMGRRSATQNPITSPLEGEVADARLDRAEAGGGSFSNSATGQHPPLQPSPSRGEGARGVGGSAACQLTWLALEPLTGRTHQLRVHCAEMGWPIVGDAIYGNAPRSGGPVLQLHAREIVVPLYKSRAPIHVIAPVPAHMRERLMACGWKERMESLRGANEGSEAGIQSRSR